MTITTTIHVGDAFDVLRTLPDESVHCIVTSPPYWGLRDYGVDRQIGLELTPEEFVARLVEVFREVRRVLRRDGTLWLNLGDSYGAVGDTYSGFNERYSGTGGAGSKQNATLAGVTERKIATGLRPKNLIGIPWRVAFALQADGWYLRSDIIWAKPNPMPESVRDRCTKAHEYVFLLTKAARYHYDADAISEPSVDPDGTAKRYETAFSGANGRQICPGDKDGQRTRPDGMREWKGTRNARSVWTIASQPFADAHFATMPPTLAERCIRAGCPKGGVVLDPFGGAGTTALAAAHLGLSSVLIELSPTYAEMAASRLRREIGTLYHTVTVESEYSSAQRSAEGGEA